MKSTVAETGDKIGNKIDCRRYGRLCADTVDIVADTVDIVADTVDTVADTVDTVADTVDCVAGFGNKSATS